VVVLDEKHADGESENGTGDDAHRAKRQRTLPATKQEYGRGTDQETTNLGRKDREFATDVTSLTVAKAHHSTAAQAIQCDSDPAPEPVEKASASTNSVLGAPSTPQYQRRTRPLRHSKGDDGLSAHGQPSDVTRDVMALADHDNDDATVYRSDSLKPPGTQRAPSKEAPVYMPPPSGEHRANHRRSSGTQALQVSACGRVIDRPVPREIVLKGPWTLPAQSDLDGADDDGLNPTRTAVRFWLTRPVESVRVVGAPCEFCLAIDGAVIEPHSTGGLLEMGDVCDTECRPSRVPVGVAGDRLHRALSLVSRARIQGQTIAPGVLDLVGIETALVFRGRLDRDTLDRMVVCFAAYNVCRECRSADGKTIVSAQWLYGS
jgi:hypothetical protein